MYHLGQMRVKILVLVL